LVAGITVAVQFRPETRLFLHTDGAKSNYGWARRTCRGITFGTSWRILRIPVTCLLTPPML